MKTKKYIHIVFISAAIICATLISKGDLFAQKRPSVRSYAFVNIISAADTLKYKQVVAPTQKQLEEEIIIGLSANDVIDILGYPADKVKVVYGNKEKWIFEDINIYFEDSMVKIIQKKSKA